jgi:hypothetical protein
MAKDLYHNDVRIALEKEGWIITHDPYRIVTEDTTFNVDLGAETLIGAEKQGNKIAVEIKTFANLSFVHDFHEAVGQFFNYQVHLEDQEPERELFLAVSQVVYKNFFGKPTFRKSIQRLSASILVFDPALQKITAWIRP